MWTQLTPWSSDLVFKSLSLSSLTSHIIGIGGVLGKQMVMPGWSAARFSVCVHSLPGACRLLGSYAWDTTIAAATVSATARPENTHIYTNEITVGKGIKVYMLHEVKCNFSLTHLKRKHPIQWPQSHVYRILLYNLVPNIYPKKVSWQNRNIDNRVMWSITKWCLPI